jgi:hypothetical protein
VARSSDHGLREVLSTGAQAREGRNPQTGEKMKIAASKVPAFNAGSASGGDLNTLNYSAMVISSPSL